MEIGLIHVVGAFILGTMYGIIAEKLNQEYDSYKDAYKRIVDE